jgi:hypothetical protein
MEKPHLGQRRFDVDSKDEDVISEHNCISHTPSSGDVSDEMHIDLVQFGVRPSIRIGRQEGCHRESEAGSSALIAQYVSLVHHVSTSE